MNERAFLLLLACSFTLVGFGSLFAAAYGAPAASIGGILAALAFAAAFVILALREPAQGEACPACRRAFDPTLPFCSRCGQGISRAKPMPAR